MISQSGALHRIANPLDTSLNEDDTYDFVYHEDNS